MSVSEDRLVEKIAPRNKRGATVFSKRKSRKITDLSTLNKSELQFARSYAACLKAVGYSWRYISDTLNIQTGLVKAWADDKDWLRMVEKVADDVVGGAVEHLQRHSMELTEMLLDQARREPDGAIKLKAILEGLDRVGMAKVNKSESRVTKDENKSETHTHSFSEEFMERLEGMPVDTQKKLAELMSEVDRLMVEGSKKG